MNLEETLKQAFSNINLMYLKSINFHYNIVGPTFLSLHHLFEKHYETFYNWTDIVGELLKKAHWEVRPTLAWLAKYGTIIEAQNETNASTTIKSQLSSFQTIKLNFTTLATQTESVTIADAFTTLLHTVDQEIWFMQALLVKHSSIVV